MASRRLLHLTAFTTAAALDDPRLDKGGLGGRGIEFRSSGFGVEGFRGLECTICGLGFRGSGF